MLKKYSGVIALLVTVIFWGPGPVVTKLALTEVPEFSFAFLGRVLALFILLILFARSRPFKINRKDLPKFILAGLTGSVFNIGFFIYGIQLTNAMDAQAIFSTAPVLTTAFAYFALREKINLIQIGGVAIGFLGALLIATRDFFDTGSLHFGNVFGNFLVFLAAISFVFYILISKKLSKTYSPITITCYSFLVSTVVFIPFALYENLTNTTWLENLGFQGVFGILYIGIFASVVAFLAYQIGIKLTSAFAAGVVLYLNPVVTTLVAVLVLGEKITLPFVLGASLIILGSIIATQHEIVRRNISLKFLGM